MFTQRHYKKIAEVLASEKPIAQSATGRTLTYSEMDPWQKGTYDEWNTIVMATARMLKSDNPRFDQERFMAACGSYA